MEFDKIFARKISIYITACLLFGYACETKIADPLYIGEDYFGLMPHAWIIYDVDSTVYDDFLGEVFHYQYQVMEVNQGFFTGDTGSESMLIEGFWRKSPQDSWTPKNVWTSKIEQNRALINKENITYVKLAFPLKLHKQWDGNAFNNKTTQNYQITKIHQPLNVGPSNFDSTLRVLQKDFTTLIGQEFQYEVYAKGLGMIEKHFTELELEVDSTITRGVRYTYTIADYGEFK